MSKSSMLVTTSQKQGEIMGDPTESPVTTLFSEETSQDGTVKLGKVRDSQNLALQFTRPLTLKGSEEAVNVFAVKGGRQDIQFAITPEAAELLHGMLDRHLYPSRLQRFLHWIRSFLSRNKA